MLPSSLSPTTFIVLLLLTAINISFSAYNVAQISRLLPPPPHQYSWEGDDFPAQLPLPVTPVGLVMESTAPYFSLYNDDDWGSVFPSDGFTYLGPHNRTFQVTMIHQLHCLDVIRVGFVVNGSDAAHHIEHCLRYLRQVLLCTADTTLESTESKVVDGELRYGASGIGMVHRCRDWSAVRHYLAENAIPSHIPP
ncbi:hypothetical protein B0H21DRAFT_700566 [Amylocystis lapponica]|nr:hypothetical protein B0H21DRAFT_700566 [Amylocystis lapponica]